jgi:hypothetical protein
LLCVTHRAGNKLCLPMDFRMREAWRTQGHHPSSVSRSSARPHYWAGAGNAWNPTPAMVFRIPRRLGVQLTVGSLA